MIMSALSSDHWVKCISTHGNLRGVAIQATDLVQSMAIRQHLKGAAIRGLGESVMGALLTAALCKHGQRINLNIRGTGLFQQALVDAYPEGNVRGYIIEQSHELPVDESLGPWGSGLLSMLRTQDEAAGKGGSPYIGTVPLITGHLAKDLSFYWAQSEQIPSAVGLAVSLEGERILSAGGFLIQAMPGASSEEIQTVEQHIQEIESLSKLLETHKNPTHLLSQIFQSTPFMIVDEKPVAFSCNCSWERVQRALTLVGVEELQSMLLEDHSAMVRCDFCSNEYHVDAKFLEKLIAGLLNR